MSCREMQPSASSGVALEGGGCSVVTLDCLYLCTVYCRPFGDRKWLNTASRWILPICNEYKRFFQSCFVFLYAPPNKRSTKSNTIFMPWGNSPNNQHRVSLLKRRIALWFCWYYSHFFFLSIIYSQWMSTRKIWIWTACMHTADDTQRHIGNV